MADPHHVPELDAHDRLTVRLYRTGIALTSAGLLALTGSWALANPAAVSASEWLVVAGTAAAVANMHLYDKRIRWVIGASAWLGVTLFVAAPLLPELGAHWVHHAGLGFVFVAISAFAIKEQFCFKIPALRAVPIFLALSLIPMLAGLELAAAATLLPAALITAAMAVAKVRMPLHFDVGNKAAYQV